ncbi:glycosyltransferase family 2 protein [Microbacterium sp. zg.Y1090]|uniref:glycosyltransferase family 2 protein n=1 Tax=Microbacterium wangruii TaxID=3049073 RepID=UPI00214B6FEB|nr:MULTISPECIES: glycosyltransferase family A protein [unclassified Microbacterium]MCR2818057.1 glycosyltransferase family 2 protein [Microbacterium sp. zg.Y1090]WIM27785.1 glycosyltransferase family A protein [Microbacterium sp. zg-Y1090]
MTTDPQVAVVVRTKDRPHFLRRALTSITAQTMGDWECVIVNDGGDPGPVETLVDALAPEHRARVRMIHSEQSRGRWKSANAGVLATSAPLLVLHDDDDSWHPHFLDDAVRYLDAHPERDGVVGRIEIVWERRNGDDYTAVRREIFQPELQDVLLSDALLFNRYVPIGFVYRRRLHEELGLYDDSLPVIGDWAFNLKVLQRGALEYLGEEPRAYWHQREGDTGADANSVIGARNDHSRYDALLRDDAFRGYAQEHGLGLVLYLTKFIDRRFVDVENGIRAEIYQLRPAVRVRRRLGALLRSLRRSR